MCRIRVAGVPGPIYRGHLDAMKHFLKIVVFIFFVFVVIMSFGRVYKVRISASSPAETGSVDARDILVSPPPVKKVARTRLPSVGFRS